MAAKYFDEVSIKITAPAGAATGAKPAGVEPGAGEEAVPEAAAGAPAEP